MIEFFESFTGSNLLVEYPPKNIVHEKLPGMPIISLIEELKKLSILNDFYKLEKIPDEPGLIRFYASRGKNHSTGESFNDAESAMIKSLAELTERHLWVSDFLLKNTTIRKAPFREVKKNP